MSDREEDIIEVVDGLADQPHLVELDPARVEREAARLGISDGELRRRVANEVAARRL